MLEEFEIHHKKRTPYHSQANGTVEAFNNILENALKNIFNVNKYDWDMKVPTMLRPYRTTCNNITVHTSFRLVYVEKQVVPLEYLIPSLCLATITNMTKIGPT
jgi:hypothetical protein